MLRLRLDPPAQRAENRFDLCLAAVLHDRNGYTTDLDGPTNHGISQEFYTLWRESNLQASRDVWRIDFREVEEIYRASFWTTSHAHECPPPLDLLVFECAVESGPKWAIQTLQQALRLRRDGLFDRRTRERLRCVDSRAAALDFLQFRQEFYRDLSDRNPDCRELLAHRLDRMEEQRDILLHPSPVEREA